MNIILSYLRTSILLIGLIISTTVFSQIYNFTTYSIEEGLTLSQATCLCQDQKGYLWIGTLGGGVCRFDGKTFKTYSTKNNLKSNSIRAIFEDSKNRIWIGTEGGGISVLKNDSIITYTTDNGLCHNSVFAISQDVDGNIWVGTYGGGISVLINGTDSIKNITKESGLLDNRVNVIYVANDGKIWIGTRAGLNIIDKNNKIQSFTRDDGLTFNSILFIYEDDNGSMLLGTSGGGVNFFKEGKFTALTTKDGLVNNFVFTILKDKIGRFWFGTFGGGISIYDGHNFQNITVENGLSNDYVNGVIEDREGNIWIGTNSGVCKYSGNRFLTFQVSNIASANNVFSIEKDPTGNLWVGTKGGGISKFNGKNFESFTTKNGLCDDMIYKLLKDKNNDIWAGSFGGGACMFNPALSKLSFKKLQIPEKVNTPNYDYVLTIYSDHNENLWFGTNNGGVIKYNPTSSNEEKFSFYNAENNELLNNIVIAIFEDFEKNIWFGTYSGLTRYNPLKNEFIHFSTKNGLSHNTIISICEDKNHDLLFGTYGGGVSKFYKKTENWISYTHKDGLTSDNIILMIYDNNWNLWLGTNLGIEKVVFEGDKIISTKHYGKSEGFLGIETNQNAVYKDANGNIWFGTVNGLVKYNPLEDLSNNMEPLTQITGMRIFLKSYPMLPNLILPYNENHITFHYVGICLTAPENVQYQYQMDGFDPDWMPNTNDKYMTYSNLPPGEYIFKVKACNNDGVWNKEPVTYSFTITPPFWQTWWFYTISVIMIALSITIFIKVRTQKLADAKRILEEKVIERTEEVVRQKEVIEKKNQSLESANIEIAKQKEIVDLKNKDITDSIKYAKQIQEAILPNRKFIQTIFPSSFIFYQPKDIVSGDFYWFSKKNNQFIIAAVDCTGHGVPGAFMSVVGNTLLNQIVNENSITKPSEILDNLNYGVRRALRQHEKGSGSRDGMDIALCTIEIEENNNKIIPKSLQFAGANRPLFFIKEKKLEVIKGTKYAIGGLQIDEKHTYQNHEFGIQKGDAIYLTSDGYIDQFGGPKGKKFMTRRFLDLLMEYHKKDVNEQYKYVEKNFVDWKKNLDQIDDVLVIGIIF